MPASVLDESPCSVLCRFHYSTPGIDYPASWTRGEVVAGCSIAASTRHSAGTFLRVFALRFRYQLGILSAPIHTHRSIPSGQRSVLGRYPSTLQSLLHRQVLFTFFSSGSCHFVQ
ncbi:hypothetical protein VTI28DRAFT_8225 [Corynascus sepedonium]